MEHLLDSIELAIICIISTLRQLHKPGIEEYPSITMMRVVIG
jgi:hypothetical protein